MKTFIYWTVISISLAVIAFPVALYFGVNACISETFVSLDIPHTRDEALKQLGKIGPFYYFPNSARDIYAFLRSEGTQQEFHYVRFTATSDDIEEYINYWLSEHQRTFPRDHTLRSPITKNSFESLPRYLPDRQWWQPNKIVEGIYVRTKEGLGTHFWVNALSGTIFHYDTF